MFHLWRWDPTIMRARIFLSYSRQDGDAACAFFETALRNLGHAVYRDLTNNYGGDYWQQRIKNEIREADVFVLIVTPKAMVSANVAREWNEALALHKRIVPLVVPPSADPATSVPSQIFALYHYRDLREARDYQLEPTFIHQMIEHVQQEIRREFNELETQLRADVPDATKQAYLHSLLEDLRRFVVAEPRPPLPPEVLRVLLELTHDLVRALAAGNDLEPLLDAMIAGTYTRPGWDAGEAYRGWLEPIARGLEKVRRSLPGIQVPVIVIAMTDAEARDLASGEAFTGWPTYLREELDGVRANLPNEWQARYGPRREQWRPFGDHPVRDLVRNALAMVEICRCPLRPSFVDIRDLRTAERRRQLLELRGRSCLVVVDAISTRHPALQAAFRASHLDASPQAVIVRALAHQSLAALAAGLSVGVCEWLDSEFNPRNQLDDDPRCVDVADWPQLRKLIRNELPRLLPECGAERNSLWEQINRLGATR